MYYYVLCSRGCKFTLHLDLVEEAKPNDCIATWCVDSGLVCTLFMERKPQEHNILRVLLMCCSFHGESWQCAFVVATEYLIEYQNVVCWNSQRWTAKLRTFAVYDITITFVWTNSFSCFLAWGQLIFTPHAKQIKHAKEQGSLSSVTVGRATARHYNGRPTAKAAMFCFTPRVRLLCHDFCCHFSVFSFLFSLPIFMIN